MEMTIEATFERGVFRPLQPVELGENERVRLLILSGPDVVARRRQHRITIAPHLAQAIAEDPELARRP